MKQMTRNSPSRPEYLGLVGTATVGGVAGCSFIHGGDDESRGGDKTPSVTPSDYGYGGTPTVSTGGGNDGTDTVAGTAQPSDGDGPSTGTNTPTGTTTPTAMTPAETSGVAELEDGRADIELPDHFGWVTDDDEPIHVQTTPYSADSGGFAIVERSTDRLAVEDLDGGGDYKLAYTARGTREGHADKAVVREPSATGIEERSPAPADD